MKEVHEGGMFDIDGVDFKLPVLGREISRPVATVADTLVWSPVGMALVWCFGWRFHQQLREMEMGE